MCTLDHSAHFLLSSIRMDHKHNKSKLWIYGHIFHRHTLRDIVIHMYISGRPFDNQEERYFFFLCLIYLYIYPPRQMKYNLFILCTCQINMGQSGTTPSLIIKCSAPFVLMHNPWLYFKLQYYPPDTTMVFQWLTSFYLQ